MSNAANREPARDPQDLERMLIERQWAGDIEGMLALFEPDAVVDSGAGELIRGREATRALFEQSIAAGRKFQRGEQRPALVNGDLALTSTKLPDGSITTEVARRQSDETWLWAIDRYSVAF
ncbi:nuclear transport factor 2 family protein [Mesorhizobium sp. VK22B]|uniref:Nuclear transport factor 2 family protein n=1 Tax=Mesorhizobium captivum TaxID=3072319 RepID=A0ABU4YXY5_9HYPH|nr:nuclear transport factor 2 family protein [Mesorhizobium sp. VK22B]MDX8490704.1 nuclear transport factor 2 family protein [Mesorhizobium sp. VK22B]